MNVWPPCRRRWRFLLALVPGLLLASPAQPQNASPSTLRQVPVAETRLLMQGINQPNFRALEALFRQKPTDPEAWTFARGQALLIAENGNLLMLRPPRNEGRDAWMNGAVDLRVSATRLARSAAARDYEAARGGVVELAHVCNQCHQTFRVSVRLNPFTEPSGQSSHQ